MKGELFQRFGRLKLVNNKDKNNKMITCKWLYVCNVIALSQNGRREVLYCNTGFMSVSPVYMAICVML